MAGNDRETLPVTAEADQRGAFALAVAQAIGGMRVHARDRLVARAAHDLRSPLNGIQGWTHVLSSRLGQEGGLIAKALDGIRSGVQQQVQMIGDLTDLLHVMTAELSLEFANADAAALLERAMAEAEPSAQARSVRLALGAAAPCPAVYADTARLTQALRYIIVHCVRCAMEGDVIALSLTHSDADTVFHIGAPNDDASGVADRVVTKTPSALLLAERLVDLHGGRLHAFALDADGIRQGYRVMLPDAAAARLVKDPAAYRDLASARAQMPRDPLRVAVRSAGAAPQPLVDLLNGLGCVTTLVDLEGSIADVDVELVPRDPARPSWPGQGRLAYDDTDAAAGGVISVHAGPLQVAGMLLAACRPATA